MSSNKRKPYVKPQVASFAIEERFTALQHLVADLGADVRRVELELRRNKIERSGEKLLKRASAEIARVLRTAAAPSGSGLPHQLSHDLELLMVDVQNHLQELR